MSNVPGYLSDPLGVILEAIDSTRGVETSPIPMSVNEKDVDEDPDSSKAVKFKAKIHVDKNKRTQVRNDIVDYLNNILDNDTTADFQEIKVGTKSNPDADQFDMVIGYAGKKPQVIRILVKPTSAGGSGGGAAKTKIQEVGQALFTAIRYIKGHELECHPTDISKCLTTADYEKGMELVDCNNEVSIQEIEGLEQSWKDAFILGANRIAKEVQGSGWEFVRGDRMIEGAISRAFNRVKKNSSKAPVNEDKWNPSDIWMVKSSDKNNIVAKLDGEETIDCLNDYIAIAFKEHKLIGLSLKKLGPSARWTIMNEPNAKQLDKAQKVRYIKNRTLSELTAFSGMDAYFVYTPSGGKTKDSFQARNFGGKNKGQWQFELKGVTAAQGKIKGEVARKLLKAAKDSNNKPFKNIPDEPTFAECKPDAPKADKITKEIYDIMNGLNPKPQGWDKIKKRPRMTKEETIMAEIASQETSWRFSKLAGLKFLAWLNKLGSDDADKAMKELYLYASSQTDKSSVYYKLY